MPETSDVAPGKGAFDPLAPFADAEKLKRLLESLGKFRYKLYGSIPNKLHRGAPTEYDFDLNLGVVHFTEQDFRGLSDLFAKFNKAWGTRMTYCVYPSKEKARDMILNVRGSPRAPAEID